MDMYIVITDVTFFLSIFTWFINILVNILGAELLCCFQILSVEMVVVPLTLIQHHWKAPRSKSSFVGNISLTILYPVHRTKESYLCETALSKNPLESFDSEKLEDRELSIQ